MVKIYLKLDINLILNGYKLKLYSCTPEDDPGKW
jgi:hypothetical protein